MKNVYFIRRKDIYHADDEREDHKYIARVKTTNPKYKWRYFYTMPAYKAYLKGQEQKKEQRTNPFEKLLKTVDDVTDGARDKISNTITDVKGLVDSGKKYTSNMLSKNKSAEVVLKVNPKDVVDTFLANLATGFLRLPVTYVTENTEKDLQEAERKRLEEENRKRLEEERKRLEEERKRLEEESKVQQQRAMEEALNKAPDHDETKVDVKPEAMNIDERTEDEKFPELPRKDEEMTREEDQAVTNPNYSPDSFEYAYNCAYCTTAYDMRRRGYDVEAAPRGDDYTGSNDEIRSWYVDAPEFKDVITMAEEQGHNTDYGLTPDEAAEIVEEELLSYGEGASGHYGLWWSNGGGHAVFWEVEGGEVVIRDAQTNETHDVRYYMDYVWNVDYLRTDNLELSEEALKTVVKKKK